MGCEREIMCGLCGVGRDGVHTAVDARSSQEGWPSLESRLTRPRRPALSLSREAWGSSRGSEKTQFSCWKAGRSGRIRTCDPLVPNEVRYQAALHSGAGPAIKAACPLVALI